MYLLRLHPFIKQRMSCKTDISKARRIAFFLTHTKIQASILQKYRFIQKINIIGRAIKINGSSRSTLCDQNDCVSQFLKIPKLIV